MTIEIPIRKCEHIIEYSSYNKNYYKLPYKVLYYDCVLEICNEEYDSYLYVFGYLKNLPFKQYDENTFFVHSMYGFNVCHDFITFDTNDMGKEYY